MPKYTGQNRSEYRMRRSQKEAPHYDAITTALAAQVIICVILLIVVALIKKTDEAGYYRLKEQYTLMFEDVGETSKAIEFFSDFSSVPEKIITSFEKFLNDFFKRENNTESNTTDTESSADESGSFSAPEYNYLDKLAITYMSISAGGGKTGGLAFGDSGGEMLFAPEGVVLSPVYLGAKVKPPLTGLITSDFSYRYHPITQKDDFHTGIDIAAPEGKSILAALPGEVIEVGWSDTYGNYIVLQHATNLKTSYSHCSEIIAKTGMFVRQGERIALVGKTGAATGPHLHFSVIVEGEFTDPGWILDDYIKLVA